MRTIMVDRLEFDDAAKARKTTEGYLVAMPRVARTGIQVYKGSEVGKADRDTVRVYRPAAEVFKRGAFDSLAHRPLTDDHPSVPVSASNWRDLAIGHTDGEVVRDGEFVRVPMILMDQRAVEKYEAGKAELSVGYTCDLKWEEGRDPEGHAYDAIQTDIRANHIAQVDRARGGHKLRIGDDGSLIAERSSGEGTNSNLRDDHQPGDNAMDVKKTTLTVDGVSCTMDEQTAQIVQRAQDAAKQALADATAKIAQLMADAKLTAEEMEALRKKKKEELESKDAEIAALNKKLSDSVMTPDKIAALVKDRAETFGKAKTILGDKAPANLDTLDTAEVKKIVVLSQLGDVAKDWDANALNVAFTTLAKDVKAAAPAAGAAQTVDGGAVQQLQLAFNKPAPVNDATKAYDERNKRLQDAWKTPRKSA